jgi:hypothetical protein
MCCSFVQYRVRQNSDRQITYLLFHYLKLYTPLKRQSKRSWHKWTLHTKLFHYFAHIPGSVVCKPKGIQYHV